MMKHKFRSLVESFEWNFKSEVLIVLNLMITLNFPINAYD